MMRTAIVCAATGLLGTPVSAQSTSNLPAIVLEVGEVPIGGLGRPITYLSGPSTNAEGSLGIIAHLQDDGFLESCLWYQGEVEFLARDIGATTFHGRILSLGSLSFSFSPPYAIYANELAETRALRSHRGVVQREGDPAPGLPGQTIQFVDQVRMLSSGSMFWTSYYVNGGQKAVFYTSPDATEDTVQLLLRDGDFIDGWEIYRNGLAGDFDVSDNGRHHAHVITVKPGLRSSIYLDGAIKLVKGDRVKGGGKWSYFKEVATDNDGHVLFVGNTDDDPGRDDVLATLHGGIFQREGDTVDGVYLRPPASARQLQSDAAGRALWVWVLNGIPGPYALFYTPRLDRAARQSRHVISEKTWLDLDGDGGNDVFLNEFRFGAGRTASFGPGSVIYLAVELYEPTKGYFDAVISYPLPPNSG